MVVFTFISVYSRAMGRAHVMVCPAGGALTTSSGPLETSLQGRPGRQGAFNSLQQSNSTATQT